MKKKDDDIYNTETEVVETRDGSHTVYSNHFNQHYHNPNGAVSESRHVFFGQTHLLEDLKSKPELEILEVGFGTGLNLLLLLDYHLELESETQVTYHTVEAYPLKPGIAETFNYREHIKHPELLPSVTDIFSNIDDGFNEFDIRPEVHVRLFNGMFDDYKPGTVAADYIFHDAFSPDVNAELWTGETFKKLKSMSAGDAVLTTYGAASAARGAMAWAGWHVARAPGALGKREMTVASPDPNKIVRLERINEERLAARYERGEF